MCTQAIYKCCRSIPASFECDFLLQHFTTVSVEKIMCISHRSVNEKWNARYEKFHYITTIVIAKGFGILIVTLSLCYRPLNIPHPPSCRYFDTWGKLMPKKHRDTLCATVPIHAQLLVWHFARELYPTLRLDDMTHFFHSAQPIFVLLGLISF